MSGKPRYDWAYYRDRYVASGATLAELALLPNAPNLTTLKRRSASEDWTGQRSAYQHQTATRVLDMASTTEAEVSARHVRIARALQAKALERLRDMPVSEMSAAEVRAYLRDAAEIERRALGLDTVRMVHLSKRPEDMTDDELRAAMREYGLSE